MTTSCKCAGGRWQSKQGNNLQLSWTMCGMLIAPRSRDLRLVSSLLLFPVTRPKDFILPCSISAENTEPQLKYVPFHFVTENSYMQRWHVTAPSRKQMLRKRGAKTKPVSCNTLIRKYELQPGTSLDPLSFQSDKSLNLRFVREKRPLKVNPFNLRFIRPH